MDYVSGYQKIRNYSIALCKPLQTEDYVAQPAEFVSPPKWHLGHTTWFFETFILKAIAPGYIPYDKHYNFLFNSYYETAGERIYRAERGSLTRPTVEEIMDYRMYVDKAMLEFLQNPIDEKTAELLAIGLNHEQQHQELLVMDINNILGHNPLYPAYLETPLLKGTRSVPENNPVKIAEGLYEIGFEGNGFCYDNEKRKHKVYLEAYQIDSRLILNGEFLEFMEAGGGYKDFHFWHADGWAWLKANEIEHPLYWHVDKDSWQEYNLAGLHLLDKKCSRFSYQLL